MARHKNKPSKPAPPRSPATPATANRPGPDTIPLWRLRLLTGVFSAVILLSGIVAYRQTVRAIFSSSSVEKPTHIDDLNDAGKRLRTSATVTGTPVANEYGLCVPPGGGFEAKWAGQKTPDELPYVRVWMHGGEAAENRVTFRSAGVQETLRVHGQVQSLLVRPSKLPRESSSYEVAISSSLAGGRTSRPVFVLDRVEVGLRVFPNGEIQSGFWSVFPAALLPFALFQMLSGRRLSSRAAVLAAGLGSAAVALAGISSATTYPACAFGVILLILGDFAYVSTRGGGDRWSGRMGLFLLGAAVSGMALAIRWQWYLVLLDAPLAPDAGYYESTAQAMTSVYDTGVREPFHMWMIWIFSTITAWGPLTLRLLTVVLSVVEAGLLFVLACEFLPRLWSVLVLLLYALNPLLAASAPMGLREEALPIVWILFLLGCIRGRRSPHRWQPQAMIFAGALGLVLTRINALSLVVPLYAVYAYLARWPRKYSVAVSLALVLLVTPHFIHNRVKNGDWMKSTNIHAMFLRNLEFAGRPGHITREEFDRDAFAGTPVTMGEFLLKMHSPANLTTGTLAGLWKMSFGDVARKSLLRVGWSARADEFRNPVMPAHPPRIHEWIVFLLYVVGIVASFRLKNGWVLPVSILIFQLPIAFMAGWGLLMIRHMSNHTPLMLLLAGIGGDAVVGLARARYRALGERTAGRE